MDNESIISVWHTGISETDALATVTFFKDAHLIAQRLSRDCYMSTTAQVSIRLNGNVLHEYLDGVEV